MGVLRGCGALAAGRLRRPAQGIAEARAQAVLADLEALRVLTPYDDGFDVIWSPAEVGRMRRRSAF